MTNTATPAHRPGKLYQTTQILLGGLIGYIVYNGWSLPVEQLILCVAITLMAVWPGMRWLKTRPYQFPAFEAFMLTSITAYVLPLTTNHTALETYPPIVVTQAALGVLIFQCCAIFTFFQFQPYVKQGPFWNEPLFTHDISNWLPIGLWLNFTYLLLGRFYLDIPGDIDSILRAIFFGINTSCSFLLGRTWGEGKLKTEQKINVGLVMLSQSFLLMASLYLITALSGFLVFMLAFVSAGKKIPILALTLVFFTLTILHGGKSAMRDKYWEIGGPEITLTSLPSFYAEWVERGIDSYQQKDDDIKNHQLLERASLIHMLCLVIDSHSQRLPHLGGETYGHVLPQLVPRFFWPEKPTGQITKRTLAIYYGLQDEHAAKTTSIAFGQLAEAYANFGLLGLGLLGVFFGWANKLLTTWTKSAPIISNGGFIMILLMAWSLQIELPMSSWVASFYQASICVLGLPFVIRKLLG